ncbi:MAG: hypothetical protein RL021_1110 [Bacteroidota bacterium]|jgi:futalosine hydrolase
MKILMVAATEPETEQLRSSLQSVPGGNQVDFLHTGIGMVAMTYSLTRRLSEKSYDLVVNIGVAGAISPDLPIGAVVVIGKEHLYELGAQDGERFLTFAEIGLPVVDTIVPERLYLPEHLHWPVVSGITVNTVHGEEQSISRLHLRTDAAVETMEGAAFYFVCNGFSVDCLQLRAVSNKVERRNREAWDLPKAMDKLAVAVSGLLQALPGHA